MLLTTRHPRTAPPFAALGALLCAGLCALLAVLGSATPAAAHAALTGSSPADGSVVSSAPRQVTLSFSEGVSMPDGSIRVLDPKGKRVDSGTVREVSGTGGRTGGGSGGGSGRGSGRGSGESATRGVGLKSGIPHGTYTVAWHAVSADSHPVSGAFTFSVGAPSDTSANVAKQAAGSGGGTVGALYVWGRYAAYVGFILLIGGAAFVLACWPRGATVRYVQRLVVTGWSTLTGATLLMLLLRNSYTGSGELGEVFDLGGLKSVLETKPGAALVSRLLLLGAAALFVAVLFGAYTRDREASDRRDLVFGLSLGGGVVAAGLGATWAMAEHASTGVQTRLAMPVDVVHLLAVATWLGGLATLLTALHWDPPPSRAAVRRFSRIAFGSVLVLASTGLYQSWRQLGSWSALTDTSYGQLLMVKVGLIGVLLGVASISRRWTGRLPEVDQADVDEADLVEGEVEEEKEADSQTDAEAEAEPVSVGATAEEEGERASGSAPVSGTASRSGTARNAQLARQQAAVDSTRRKKAREADPERTRLRRSVLAETGIAILVLMVTTALTNTEPGRTAEATRASGGGSSSSNTANGLNGGISDSAPHQHTGPVWIKVPFDTGGPHGKGTAELRLTPGHSGRNALRLTTTAPDGKPLDAPEAKVALTLPAKKIGPIRVALERVKGAEGQWRADAVQVPMSGEWKAAVTVRTSDIDEVTQSRTVEIE